MPQGVKLSIECAEKKAISIASINEFISQAGKENVMMAR